MKHSERVLALVPARSGSKGLKDKNVLDLLGKPLMAWTIEAARAVDRINNVFVSTDSADYAEIAKKYGASVPFLREKALSSDSASLIEVVQSTISQFKKIGLEYDIVIVLQPTSPLRNSKHIDEALNLFQSWGDTPKSMASVYEVDSKYRWLLGEDSQGALKFIDSEYNQGHGFNRQRNKRVFMPNGALFIYQTKYLSSQYQPSTRPYIMSSDVSEDIDTIADFERVKKAMMRQQECSQGEDFLNSAKTE